MILLQEVLWTALNYLGISADLKLDFDPEALQEEYGNEDISESENDSPQFDGREHYETVGLVSYVLYGIHV